MLLTDTAFPSSISALCSVASADPAEMMQINSSYQISINKRPSKYSQFAPESTGGLACCAVTDKITVLFAHLPVCTVAPFQDREVVCVISAGCVLALNMCWRRAGDDIGRARARRDLRTEGPLKVGLQWAELPLSAQR